MPEGDYRTEGCFLFLLYLGICNCDLKGKVFSHCFRYLLKAPPPQPRNVYCFYSCFCMPARVWKVFSNVSLVAQMVHNLPAMQETQVWSLGQEDPWRKAYLPTPVFSLGESHGQRNLEATVHWVTNSWATTEQLTVSTVRLRICGIFLVFLAISFLKIEVCFWWSECNISIKWQKQRVIRQFY